uniref:NADH-ubiquinone oxidoreductase chain 4 n=1 Tax=Bunostomum trigonocephalum TaxID=66065 RepID=K9L331_9BILA|nr:NADH dehydrogenase subunit 4 [Bunostomum trigonocephalum]AEX98046.1 NADH dehydrogenase subunit 4 [Bunostomum trigonocephalum]AGV02093.1 NADH dehydrogenase subunits 4 [Bunostomum trigonocephalum]
MLEFLLLSLMMFFSPIYFFFFFIIFSFLMFKNISWMGLFFIIDSNVFVLLIMMMVFIYGMVLISEKNFNLLILSAFLVVICLMFFVSSNMLMLYMYFELSMFPILVMILGYGSQIEKINSGYYLLFYAAFCSFPFLFIYYKSLFMFSFCYFDFLISWELFFILSLSFMMKFPVYFLHLWLPKAHVEAPTTASMLLAGLLLKLGTAGFLRILGSMNFVYNNFWIIISLLGMILASVCCTFQSDSKSLAAYSSVTHMSFLLLSMVFIFMSSKLGGLMMMLAHGYTSTLMFYLIGEFYHSVSTRMIYFMNSFFSSSMFFGIIFSLVFLSNSGVPPSLSFLSEFLIVVNSIIISKMFFFMVFFYFMISFYYSLFLIVSSLMGKLFINISNFNVGISLSLVLMMFNIFWLSLFY